MSSWKTTVLGVAGILIAVGTAAVAYFDGDVTTEFNIELFVAEITAALGLIMARDNDKSSEEVGVK